MGKTVILTLRDVSTARDAVRSGRVKCVPVDQVEQIFVKAHSTEFFSEQDALVVEKVLVRNRLWKSSWIRNKRRPLLHAVN
jgi:hypothetical protein